MRPIERCSRVDDSVLFEEQQRIAVPRGADRAVRSKRRANRPVAKHARFAQVATCIKGIKSSLRPFYRRFSQPTPEAIYLISLTS